MHYDDSNEAMRLQPPVPSGSNRGTLPGSEGKRIGERCIFFIPSTFNSVDPYVIAAISLQGRRYMSHRMLYTAHRPTSGLTRIHSGPIAGYRKTNDSPHTLSLPKIFPVPHLHTQPLPPPNLPPSPQSHPSTPTSPRSSPSPPAQPTARARTSPWSRCAWLLRCSCSGSKCGSRTGTIQRSGRGNWKSGSCL